MSMRYSIWAAALYRRQRVTCKGHHVAIRPLAFKWIRILHRRFQDRKPYGAATCAMTLPKRDSPLLAYIVQQPLESAWITSSAIFLGLTIQEACCRMSALASCFGPYRPRFDS